MEGDHGRSTKRSTNLLKIIFEKLRVAQIVSSSHSDLPTVSVTTEGLRVLLHIPESPEAKHPHWRFRGFLH
jgi:hypothetical protein